MPKKWKLPPPVKILEALAAIADGRVEVKGNEAKVTSSMQTKQYTVVYEPKKGKIWANDNASRWQGYLGYPIIAFLLAKGIINYEKVAEALQGIKWKNLNDKYKSHEKVEKAALEIAEKRGVQPRKIKKEQERIMQQLAKLDLKKTWRQIKVKLI